MVNLVPVISIRKEVKQDEEDDEPESAPKRGSLLDRREKTGETESWDGMPKMKRMKKLMLLVSNGKEPKNEGRSLRTLHSRFALVIAGTGSDDGRKSF